MSDSRSAVWKARALRFALSTATIGVTALAGLARNKWLAVHLDARGLGILGQMIAGQTWLGVAGALGLNLALTRTVGMALGSGDRALAARATRTARVMVAA